MWDKPYTHPAFTHPTGGKTTRLHLRAGGAIHLVLWIYGLVIDQTSSADVVPVDTADNGLHFVLGVGMIALGLALSRGDVRRSPQGARG